MKKHFSDPKVSDGYKTITIPHSPLLTFLKIHLFLFEGQIFNEEGETER